VLQRKEADMNKDNGPERFINIAQFRGFSDGELSVAHLARVIHYEAVQPGQSLRKVLKEKILFGNFGDVGRHELRQLARILFCGETFLSIVNDNCLGYTEDDVAHIRDNLAQEEPAPSIAQLLGFIPPQRRL
jgi:hypothetical protein